MEYILFPLWSISHQMPEQVSQAWKYCDFTICILKSIHTFESIINVGNWNLSHFFFLPFPLILSFHLSHWLLLDKVQNEIQMFPFSLSLPHHRWFFRWSGLMKNEKIYIQKKHQTKQKFMAIWIFEQKIKSTHAHTHTT